MAIYIIYIHYFLMHCLIIRFNILYTIIVVLMVILIRWISLAFNWKFISKYHVMNCIKFMLFYRYLNLKLFRIYSVIMISLWNLKGLWLLATGQFFPPDILSLKKLSIIFSWAAKVQFETCEVVIKYWTLPHIWLCFRVHFEI